MTLLRRQLLRLAAGVGTLPAFPRIALALDYPTRPVHVVVGFAEGGGPNVVAHIVGEHLAERVGKQSVVERRPGAGSSIAAEYLVKAKLAADVG